MRRSDKQLEQFLDQLVARKAVMSRNIPKDRGERADAQLVMIGNRYVMLLWLCAGQPDMASGLPRDPVAECCKGFD
jgi:hypothetical protein